METPGNLFVTTGDRFTLKEQAQNPANHIAKILRITPDGKPAPGNPFLQREGTRPEIWSLGHRNLQSAALHPGTGQLWTVEHGARGGDEVGRNLRRHWAVTGRAWIDAEPGRRPQRLLAAAALALETENLRAERGDWRISDDPVCAAACVLDWAQLQLTERGTPDRARSSSPIAARRAAPSAPRARCCRSRSSSPPRR